LFCHFAVAIDGTGGGECCRASQMTAMHLQNGERGVEIRRGAEFRNSASLKAHKSLVLATDAAGCARNRKGNSMENGQWPRHFFGLRLGHVSGCVWSYFPLLDFVIANASVELIPLISYDKGACQKYKFDGKRTSLS